MGADFSQSSDLSFQSSVDLITINNLFFLQHYYFIHELHIIKLLEVSNDGYTFFDTSNVELNTWNKSDSIHYDRHHSAAKGLINLIRPVSLRANHVCISRDVAFV